MSLIDEHCCPGESSGGEQGPVLDVELLALAILNPDHWRPQPGGAVSTLSYSAIGEKDIKGALDSDGRKRGVSFERSERCQADWLLDRMRRLTGSDDPALALGYASALRAILTPSGCREVCVHAEPTGDEDYLGPSASHGVVRASPQKVPPPNGASWLQLRHQVAKSFHAAIRLASGNPA